QQVRAGRAARGAGRCRRVLARRQRGRHLRAAAFSGSNRVRAGHRTRSRICHRLRGRPVREHPGRDVQPALPGGAGVEEVLTFAAAAGWEAWLAAHHEHATGVWVKVAKKGSARGSITAAEAGEVALCYGWIDSLRRSASDGFFLQKYSRRKPHSSWSRINVDPAQTPIAARRVVPPGVAQIDARQADGAGPAA